MNRLMFPLKKRRSSLITPIDSFYRDTEVRKNLSEAELAEAEGSLTLFCKPVELYKILHRKKNAVFLPRSLHFKLQAKNKRRIQVSISVRRAISDGLQTPNLFPLYILLARPVSTPNGERSTSYRFKRASKLTTFIEGQTVSSAQAKFILPEINKLSTEVESGSIAMLLLNCVDINNSKEIDLTKTHTFSPSYEGYCLFGKIPIDFLHSSRSPNLSLGERVEVLSTVTMQSCYMKSHCSDKEKCLSFHFPHISEAVSILLQVPIAITAEELGAKDKSPYDLYPNTNFLTDSPLPVIRLRAGNVVFLYRYYNNKLQRSEVTDDYSCPFCLLKCGSYNGLKCHLTASHDLLRYEFWVDEDNHIVIVYDRADVNIDEIFDSPFDRKQLIFQFCHRPMRRQTLNANHVGPLVLNSDNPTIPVGLRDNLNAKPVSNAAAITSVPPESADLSVPESNVTPLTMVEFKKTRTLSVEQSATRNQMLLHKRQFFNSHAAQVTLGEPERLDCDVDNLNTTHMSNAAAITSVGSESTNLSVPESNITSCTLVPSAKTRNLSVDQSATKQQMPLHKRQFFHSHSSQPMAWEQVNADEDSEDDVDIDVADTEDRRLLEDFIDVDQHEKRLMHLWKSLIRKQRVLSDSQTPWACEVFSDLHGSELVQTPQLRSHWDVFIVQLWNNGLIDSKTVDHCSEIIDKYRDTTFQTKIFKNQN